MKKISVCLLICIIGAVCAACAEGSPSKNVSDSSSASRQPATAAESSREHGIETETQSEIFKETVNQTEALGETEGLSETETENPYISEINTVESLEDDGKEMSAAEALRSALRGKRSALDLVDSFDEKYGEDRVFSDRVLENKIFDASEIKDYPNDGLARINVLEWNRLWVSGIPNSWKWESFTCVDLDNDGAKEIFLKSEGCDAILYYCDDDVYISYIDMGYGKAKIYKNGILSTISGAAYTDDEYNRFYYKFRPVKGALYRELLAGSWYEAGQIHYTLDHRIIKKEEYDAHAKDYIKEITGGSELEWHDFSEENIDKYVVD